MPNRLHLARSTGAKWRGGAPPSRRAIEAALDGRTRRRRRAGRACRVAERSRCNACASSMPCARMNGEVVPELAWQMGRPVRYGGELRWLRGARRAT